MKDGSFLVVTPSSIPISATRGLDSALSSEEYEDILKDPDDEPVLGRRISESEEEEFIGMCYLSSLLFFFSSPFFLLSSLFSFFVCMSISLVCRAL